ncbi:MAG: ketopantoate reductase family protein [Granulosicoccus sp.]
MKVLILGASYGSLLSTKLLMAGHDVTLVCRDVTANLINTEGTQVRLKLRDESEPRIIKSAGLPGKVDAETPDKVNPSDFDLVCLAMQEPQYSADGVKQLMKRVAQARTPCLSIMNMPPLPYLARIESLANADLSAAYDDPSVWQDFEPGLISLCSPDPQAFRPPEEKANFLHVGLPTNFKAAIFADEKNNIMLRQLESDILDVRLDDKEVPVKLRVFDSLFVPMAKWSMLLTGNYRCVTADDVIAIKDAVHGDLDSSRDMYAWVDALARELGADAADQVPFDKYANAAKNLLKPSSVARAIDSGASKIERVDKLVQMVGASMGLESKTVDSIVNTVDARLVKNISNAA